MRTRLWMGVVLWTGLVTPMLAGCPSRQRGANAPETPGSGNETPFVAKGPKGTGGEGSGSLAEIRRLIGAGRCSEALRRLDAMKTPRADKFYYQGVCLMKQGKTAEAQKAFDEALEHKPDFPEKYVNAAGLLLQQGKAAKAMGLLEEAVKRFPREASLWFNLGLARLSTGRVRGGAEAFERAASASPARSKYQVASGIAWLRLRQFARARVRFRKAVQLSPASADAAEGLARSLAGLGKKMEAVTWARKALSLDPHGLGRRHLLAGLLLDAGKAREAAAILEDLTHRLPNKAVVFLRWGQALEKAGEKAKALAALEEAGELALRNPTKPRVMTEIADELARRGKHRFAKRLRSKMVIPRPVRPRTAP